MKYAFPSLALVALGLGAGAVLASDVVVPEESSGPAANDNLNAVLWDQSAVEAQAVMTQAYVLAKLRFDEALANKGATADPSVQTGDFASKPPAVVLDVD